MQRGPDRTEGILQGRVIYVLRTWSLCLRDDVYKATWKTCTIAGIRMVKTISSILIGLFIFRRIFQYVRAKITDNAESWKNGCISDFVLMGRMWGQGSVQKIHDCSLTIFWNSWKMVLVLPDPSLLLFKGRKKLQTTEEEPRYCKSMDCPQCLQYCHKVPEKSVKRWRL